MNSVKYSILFLMPIIKTKIWAGSRLSTVIKDYGSNVGEVWLCSGLEDSSNIITNIDENVTLKEFYENNRNLFSDNIKQQHNPQQDFPLLVKFIDAGNDLSIQLHPNYKDERSYLNKNEAWYILDCAIDNKILYGHHALNLNEFKQHYSSGDYDTLFHFEPIHPQQIWYIPSGTIHAIMSNTLVLEVQQPSDITYRLYDYNRLDDSGNLRELHVDKVYQHLSCDSQDYFLQQRNHNHNLQVIENSLQNILTVPDFKIYRISVNARFSFNKPNGFLCCQVIHGSGKMLITQDGTLRQYDLLVGTSFIVLNTINNIEFIGHMTIMVEMKC
jgi:mannose-6-phosphate isomerase